MRRSFRSQVQVSPAAAGALNIQPSPRASLRVMPDRVKARYAAPIPASRMPGRTYGLSPRRRKPKVKSESNGGGGGKLGQRRGQGKFRWAKLSPLSATTRAAPFTISQPVAPRNRRPPDRGRSGWRRRRARGRVQKAECRPAPRKGHDDHHRREQVVGGSFGSSRPRRCPTRLP